MLRDSRARRDLICGVASISLMSVQAVSAAPVSSRTIGKTPFSVDGPGLQNLCAKAKAPCGLMIDSSHPLKARPALVTVSSSTTLAEALDEFVRRAPSYHWLEDHGVVRIEPIHPPSQIKHTFFEQPLARSFDKMPSNLSAYAVMPAVPVSKKVLMQSAADAAPPFRRITIRLEAESIVSALDQIVKADGMAIWIVEYHKPTDDPPFSLSLQTWRGSGVPLD